MKKIFLFGCLMASLSTLCFTQTEDQPFKPIEFIGKKPYYEGERLGTAAELNAVISKIEDQPTLNLFNSMKTNQTISIVSLGGGVLFSALALQTSFRYAKAVDDRDWGAAYELENTHTKFQLGSIGFYTGAIVFGLIQRAKYRQTAASYNRAIGQNLSHTAPRMQIGLAPQGLGVGLKMSLR